MLTIKNELTCGNLEYSSGDYKFKGDFKIVPTNGKVYSFNVQISTDIQGESDYIGNSSLGNVSAYTTDSTLKISLSGVDQSISDTIVNMMNNMVTELQAKYIVIQ